MSLAADRAVLATALRSIEGVKAAYEHPAAGHMNKGDSWVIYSGLNPGDFGGNRWTLVIILGQDLESASRMLDTTVPSAVAQIEEELTITDVSVESFNMLGQSVTTGSATLGLMIEGVREREF